MDTGLAFSLRTVSGQVGVKGVVSALFDGSVTVVSFFLSSFGVYWLHRSFSPRLAYFQATVIAICCMILLFAMVNSFSWTFINYFHLTIHEALVHAEPCNQPSIVQRTSIYDHPSSVRVTK